MRFTDFPESDYRTYIRQGGTESLFKLSQRLADRWMQLYRQRHGSADLVEVTLPSGGSSFTYLFDLQRQRSVVAFGMPIYQTDKRDNLRMKGAPLGAAKGSGYHRGHLIAHSLGGGCDINLVPQLGRVNVGEFRVLEIAVRELAEQNVLCLYFVRTLYKQRPSPKEEQLPLSIEQAVIQPPNKFQYRLHENS